MVLCSAYVVIFLLVATWVASRKVLVSQPENVDDAWLPVMISNEMYVRLYECLYIVINFVLCIIQFHASQFIHRDKDSHEDQLKLIKANQKHSVTYGINGPSCLSDLKWFDITTCIPFDLMHTIYEGIASHHLNLLFQHLINDCSYFSLDKVNHLIKSHQYGYSESDTKPCVIKWDPAASKFHFKLSGVFNHNNHMIDSWSLGFPD